MNVSQRLRKHGHSRIPRLLASTAAASILGVGCQPFVPPAGAEDEERPATPRNAVEYLADTMDRFHRTFDVYTDADAAGNHFVVPARISSIGDENALPPMNVRSTHKVASGLTAIECRFDSEFSNWGGWYWMNGVLRGSETQPRTNWGTEPNAGVNLSGATRLTFKAAGARGGEHVEFFTQGVGRDPETGARVEDYPDSSAKVTLGIVTLSTNWRDYEINLSNRDLSYVLDGFGWVASAPDNLYQDITFYVDDIRFDKPRLDEPRFLLSYETLASENSFDQVMRNTAFVYDNAVALMAFLASGETNRAKLLADAFVAAVNHDRFFTDGRIRNAYKAGDLVLPAGWTPNDRAGAISTSGWYDAEAEQWFEDKIQLSTNTGNVAWAMLALLAFYESHGGEPYLDAATTLGEWVEINCRDERGAGGYTAGFEGWEPNPDKLSYKATEHNIDLTPAFQRLASLTGTPAWNTRADHAKRFVLAMWDAEEDKFWTGTGDDGVTVNTDVIPLDIQSWAILALRDESDPYWGALDYAESHHRAGDGFDFNDDLDGVWFEGTAQMVVALSSIGRQERAKQILDYLHTRQKATGALSAADRDGLTTGFQLSDGTPWLYYNRSHVGATAWLVLAEENANPFWLGTE
ncbi:MAG: hypothetical protein EDM74_06700 [Armatimonadetes bacterium]|nr:MAG: hypothetical protein EDM74_06700 [Armatimonadota bacterium]